MPSSSIPRFLSSWVRFKNPIFSLSYTTISSFCAEKYLTHLQKNGSSMPSSSIPRFFSSWKHPHLTSISAEKYLTQLQKNGPNPEKCLNEVDPSHEILDESCVKVVLGRCAPNQPLLGLRFFVWAGLQPKYKHSSYRYARVCKLFEITRNPQLVKDVIEAYRVEGCVVSVETFRIVLNLCCEADLAGEALWVLRKMKEFNCRPDKNLYDVVIRLFCAKGELDVADGLMREMGLIDLHPDMIIYVAMLEGYFDLGRLENACGLFKYLREHGSRFPTQVVYPMLIDGLCRLSTLERTLELMEEMWTEDGKCIANTYTYTVVIQRLSANERSMEALQVLDRMVACGNAPDRGTLSSLIRGLIKEGRLEEAYKLTDKFVAGGSVSEDECYNSLMNALFVYQKVEEALQVLDRMVACGCAPNGDTLSTLIKGHIKEGRLEEAYKVTDKVVAGGSVSKDEGYNTLMNALLVYKKVEEALQVLDRMVACGCAPNGDTFRTLIKGLIKEGRLEEAYKVTDKVVAGGGVSEDECYNSLMISLLVYEKVEEAEKLSRRMLESDVKPDYSASNFLIRKLSLKRRALDAFRFYDETQKLGYSIKIDDRVYPALLDGLCEGNHLVEAVKVAMMMIERRIRLVAPYKDNVDKSLRNYENKELRATITKLKRLR